MLPVTVFSSNNNAMYKLSCMFDGIAFEYCYGTSAVYGSNIVQPNMRRRNILNTFYVPRDHNQSYSLNLYFKFSLSMSSNQKKKKNPTKYNIFARTYIKYYNLILSELNNIF